MADTEKGIDWTSLLVGGAGTALGGGGILGSLLSGGTMAGLGALSNKYESKEAKKRREEEFLYNMRLQRLQQMMENKRAELAAQVAMKQAEMDARSKAGNVGLGAGQLNNTAIANFLNAVKG